MVQEAETSEVKSTILSILKCSEDPDNLETLHHLESLCSTLLSSLVDINNTRRQTSSRTKDEISQSSVKYGKNIEKSATIRQVLGNISSTITAKLASSLADLISHRVDSHAFLPATQDSAANDEALSTTAITLSCQNFLAAKLYAVLISMPGSWGAGIIQVGALSSLNALLKRWNVECHGNSIGIDEECLTVDSTKRKFRNNSSGVTKRSRHAEVVSDDSEVENEFGFDMFGSSTSSFLNANELKVKGLDLCSSVADILCLSELRSWSGEATEVVIECTVSAMMTTSAIASHGLTTSKAGKLGTKADEVVKLLSKSLQTCALNSSEVASADDGETTVTKSSQRNIVCILRGLMPLITMQVEVPYGQNGKQAARDVAVTTLEGMVKMLSEASVSPSFSSSCVLTVIKTPESSKRFFNADEATCATKPKSALIRADGVATPVTLHKKKRVSFGNTEERRISEFSPPLLKVGNTPVRSRSRQVNGLTPCLSHGSPHVVLTSVLGLLQRLTAFKGLERAADRAQANDAIMRCLRHFPGPERVAFYVS